MRFKDIPGQDNVKQRLRAMVDNDTLPHALLLQGPPGSYKLALARALAAYIHCSNPTPDGDSCGKCPSCIQHSKFNHIDTLYVYPVLKTKKIDKPTSDDYYELWKEFADECPTADIEVWTSMLDKANSRPVIYVNEAESLVHKLNMTTHGSNRRVIIVWLPERMNVETANKLLKIIEEPHPGTTFIMASDTPEEILPTVYSRMQRVDVRALPVNLVSDILINQFSVEPSMAQMVAHTSDGDINRALRQINIDSDGSRHFDLFVSLMRLSYQRKVADLKVWAKNLAECGREDEIKFYENAIRLVRENFMKNFGNPELNYMTPDEAAFSNNFARFINEGNVERLTDVFNKARTQIAGNTSSMIVNFDTALKVCFLIRNQ